MERLGLRPEDLQGLVISYDVWVDIAQQPTKMYEYDGQNEPMFYKISYLPYSQRAPITVKVRGIVPSVEIPDDGNIFLPSDFMLKVLNNCEYDTLSIKKVSEYSQSKQFYEGDTGAFFEWSPGAYYIIVDSVKNIESIKESLQQMDPNFQVLHSYQDIEASMQLINSNKNLMIYISLAILSISFLLMALIYVSIIDHRKFEFAVL